MKQFENRDTFEGFLAIVARLRGPDGCPWDREQTHSSIKGYLLQECHEVLEAIDHAEPGKLAEELGDLLLQIGLHAQIGSERGEFSIRDVIQSINAKLIRRHPHVFGDARVSDAQEVEANWEQLKKAERGEGASALEGIPKSLPALAYSQEVQRRAARVGFDWPDMTGVLDKVREELREFEEAGSPAELEHELGDILAAMVNIGRKLNIDAEGALRQANERFRRRFSYMEAAAQRQGRSLGDLTLEQQEALWQEAKRQVGQPLGPQEPF